MRSPVVSVADKCETFLCKCKWFLQKPWLSCQKWEVLKKEKKEVVVKSRKDVGGLGSRVPLQPRFMQIYVCTSCIFGLHIRTPWFLPLQINQGLPLQQRLIVRSRNLSVSTLLPIFIWTPYQNSLIPASPNPPSTETEGMARCFQMYTESERGSSVDHNFLFLSEQIGGSGGAPMVALSVFSLVVRTCFHQKGALKRPPSLEENPIWIGLTPSLPDRWCMDYPWKWVIYGWMPSCRESRWIACLLMTSNGEMFEFQIWEETRVFSHIYSFHLM